MAKKQIYLQKIVKITKQVLKLILKRDFGIEIVWTRKILFSTNAVGIWIRFPTPSSLTQFDIEQESYGPNIEASSQRPANTLHHLADTQRGIRVPNQHSKVLSSILTFGFTSKARFLNFKHFSLSSTNKG